MLYLTVITRAAHNETRICLVSTDRDGYIMVRFYHMNQQKELKEIAKLFGKLGIIAFGGPAAHISIMEHEIVKKRAWMTHEHFLDLIGATNIIPGPNSTEMTMHVGYERAGIKGLIVAGLCFIFPAVLITGAFAWLYQQYGSLPNVQPFIYGIKPAVIAIIISALIPLAKKAIKNQQLAVLATLTLAACFFGANEIGAMFSCGAAGLLLHLATNRSSNIKNVLPFIMLHTSLWSSENLKILLSFLKVGALLYGSGYVLFAFLDAELVEKGLLTRQELIDAVAVGQFTPGPVLSTSTFVGWQLNGIWGAILATIGIFFPSFIFVALLNPFIPKIRKRPPLAATLDAINVAAVAVILYVCIQMGVEAITDWRTTAIAIGSMAALFIFKKANSAFIVVGGAAVGYLLSLV